MARRKDGPRAWVRQGHRSTASKPRWEVVWEDPDQNYKRRTKGGFSSKAEAERWRDGDECPYNNAQWSDPAKGDVTFQSIAEEWLGTYTSRSGKARGKAQHHQLLTGSRSLVRTHWGERRIGDITHADVARWVAGVSAKRKPTTVRHNFYTFRKVIQYALANGLIVRDPTAGIVMPSQGLVKAQQAKRRSLTGKQVGAIIGATPHPWQMYTLLAAKTGMRPEELLGLQIRDLNRTRTVLTVNRVSVKDEINKRWIYEDAGKTPAAHRTTTVDDYTTAHLIAYLDLHAERADRFFAIHPEREPSDRATLPLFPHCGDFRRGERQRATTPDVEAWEFTDTQGNPTPMRHGWWTRRYWALIAEAADLPAGMTFYDLRHFHASWHAARLGQPGALTIAELSERLGHASTQMTLDRYVHVEPDVDKRNASAGMFDDERGVARLRTFTNIG